MNEVNVRVARGAQWLDEKFPGWEHRINMETLDLRTGTHCICGQVFSTAASAAAINTDGFDYFLNNLFTEAQWWLRDTDGEFQRISDDGHLSEGRVSAALGFDIGYSGNWTDLQDAWVGLLKGRANSGIWSDNGV